MSIRIYRAYRNGYSFRHGFDLYVGRWACRVSFHRSGWFSNGSHYFSGWFDWREEDERLYAAAREELERVYGDWGQKE